MKQKNIFKIQTYVPKASADEVRFAIGKSGGGKLGNYSHCVFVSSGKGYFLPLYGAHPAIGEVGKIEEVEEIKIEFVCEEKNIKEVVEALKNAHPYEEVPIDIFPLYDVD